MVKVDLNCMPAIKRIGPYEFRFYVRGEAMERPHIHVRRDRNAAKFWLDVVSCASMQGFAEHELSRIERLVQLHRDEFLEAWHEFFV